MSEIEKQAAPLPEQTRPKSRFVNMKGVAGIGAGIVALTAVGIYVYGITIEDPPSSEKADIRPAQLNVNEARPVAYMPPSPPIQDETHQETGGSEPTTEKPVYVPPPKPVPQKREGTVVYKGNWANQQVAQAMNQQATPAGYGSNYPSAEDYTDQEDGGRGRGGQSGPSRRNSKDEFYNTQRRGGRSSGLDLEGSLEAEAEGCVLKAGAQIPLQSNRPVRTGLPTEVLAHIPNPMYGLHYLPDGGVEQCLAIPAFSTMLVKINSTGVERGDLRIQACATRLDLNGGGRRKLDCQAAHGADGGAGMEAESDYAIGGIVAGIIIEGALASVRSLGGLISGPPGVAVQVGTQGLSEVGSEYVGRELKRPPVLTMNAGAIFGIQLNGDLALPLKR